MSGYTSSLLCHFVGRSLENDVNRFELLTKIINGKTLIASLTNQKIPKVILYVGITVKI